jgi:hypothetical protein
MIAFIHSRLYLPFTKGILCFRVTLSRRSLRCIKLTKISIFVFAFRAIYAIVDLFQS